MKVKILGFLAMVLLLFSITACGGSTTNTNITVRTTASLPPGPPDIVEVAYFYESDACFCLALATEWIHTTINTDYKNELESGNLTYVRYDTKDSNNSDLIAEYKATNYGFYINEIKGSVCNTRPVGGLWLYTDTTGKNEMLKAKFIDLLKKELDKALAGE
ncbi:hypothetical protein ACFLYB_05585 [Chloroflexota bacterium]